MDQKISDQRIITLWDRFTHGGMGRRAFFNRLAALAGGVAAAEALLPLLQNNYALAQIVPENDPRLIEKMVPFQADMATLAAYVVRPKTAGRIPAVIVIHENRGLNPHIKDVTRRVALAGFHAVGVDFLSLNGGTPPDEDKARDMIGALHLPDVIDGAKAVVAALKKSADTTGKVGVIGFCWGGGIVSELAVADATLDAGVSYYGRQAKAADVAKIVAPLMLHYASLDERINAGIPPFEAALKAANKRFELHMYEGVNHAFNNDTSPSRYDKAAAELAWSRSMAFFAAQLGAGAPPA
jgi:carboxymethylenebutenolidase